MKNFADASKTFTYAHGNKLPTICVICNRFDSAQGYYETGNKSKVGICKFHRKHGGARIIWYKDIQMNEDIVLKLTTKEAVKLIKRARAGSRFAINFSMAAAIVDDDEHVYPSGLRSYLNLSKKEALRVVSECLSKNLEEKGGRIRISIHKTVLVSKVEVTYWIG